MARPPPAEQPAQSATWGKALARCCSSGLAWAACAWDRYTRPSRGRCAWPGSAICERSCSSTASAAARQSEWLAWPTGNNDIPTFFLALPAPGLRRALDHPWVAPSRSARRPALGLGRHAVHGGLGDVAGHAGGALCGSHGLGGHGLGHGLGGDLLELLGQCAPPLHGLAHGGGLGRLVLGRRSLGA